LLPNLDVALADALDELAAAYVLPAAPLAVAAAVPKAQEKVS
jgi:hypothetical protein